MNRAVLLGLSCSGLVGCTGFESRQQKELWRHQQLVEEQARTVTVDPSDGISEVEAYRIGLDRLASYRIEGGVTFPEDLGDYWLLHTAIGFAAMPREDILIRKSDGKTTFTPAKVNRAPNLSRKPTPEADDLNVR